MCLKLRRPHSVINVMHSGDDYRNREVQAFCICKDCTELAEMFSFDREV